MRITNSVQLVARGSESVPIDGRSLRYNWQLTGDIYREGGTPGPGSGVGAQIDVYLLDSPSSYDIKQIPFIQQFFDRTLGIDPFISVTSDPLSSDLLDSSTIAIGFDLISFLPDSGGKKLNMTLSFPDTFKLKSITFEDGTTPESLGYDVILASGTIPQLSRRP